MLSPDSMALLVARVRYRIGGRLRRTTVSVSSRLSCKLPARFGRTRLSQQSVVWNVYTALGVQAEHAGLRVLLLGIGVPQPLVSFGVVPMGQMRQTLRRW